MEIIEQTKKNVDDMSLKMEKAIVHLEEVLSQMRAGKASTNLLNSVRVDYFGTMSPLNAVASVTVPDARTIIIQPWEKKMIATIEREIINANLGFTPQNNGENIRITIPPLTEERRKELVKKVKGSAENTKVSLRNIRREYVESVKKKIKDGLPEDSAKDIELMIQKKTDSFNKQVDDLVVLKEKEIMTV